jgi:hypothetical protein
MPCPDFDYYRPSKYAEASLPFGVMILTAGKAR